jgi:hypothetical protein
VIIVSNDGDFDKPIRGQADISPVKSLPEPFKTLGLQVDVPEVDHVLEAHKDKLVEAIDREMADWCLIGDVEDAEIEETTVTEVDVKELTSFGSTEEGGSILVVDSFGVRAHVSYTHRTGALRGEWASAGSAFNVEFPLVARRTRTIEAGEQPQHPPQAEALPVGSRVFHQKFGYGTITAAEDDRLEVDFDKAGEKRVLNRFVEKA